MCVGAGRWGAGAVGRAATLAALLSLRGAPPNNRCCCKMGDMRVAVKAVAGQAVLAYMYGALFLGPGFCCVFFAETCMGREKE